MAEREWWQFWREKPRTHYVMYVECRNCKTIVGASIPFGQAFSDAIVTCDNCGIGGKIVEVK
jgi:hypothetical protein